MTEHVIYDDFDRTLGALDGLPDVVRTKPTTLRALTPLIGAAQTFIIQTVRRKDMGDTIFLEYVDRNGSTRIVIPPNVADAIARQRDALGTMVRRKHGRARAEEHREQGTGIFAPEVREKALAGLQRARAARKRKGKRA